MSTNFPTGLDAFPSAVTLAAHQLNTDPHSTLHGNLGDAVAALEAKVGIDGSGDTASIDYKLTHIPTSSITGVLPVANGGTGTSTAFPEGEIIYAGAAGIYQATSDAYVTPSPLPGNFDSFVTIAGTLTNNFSNAGLALYIGAQGALGSPSGLYMEFTGYTGSNLVAGVEVFAGPKSTGTGWASNGNANYGGYFYTYGDTVGTNVGVSGYASNSSGTNIGTLGAATVPKSSAANVGGAFIANNTALTSPVHVGVFAGLMATEPTLASSALIADNGATTDPVALFRDNGTAVVSIVDGGQVQITRGLKTAPAIKFAGSDRVGFFQDSGNGDSITVTGSGLGKARLGEGMQVTSAGYFGWNQSATDVTAAVNTHGVFMLNSQAVIQLCDTVDLTTNGAFICGQPATGTVGLTVRSIASNTANLQNWASPDGSTAYSYMSRYYNLVIGDHNSVTGVVQSASSEDGRARIILKASSAQMCIAAAPWDNPFPGHGVSAPNYITNRVNGLIISCARPRFDGVGSNSATGYLMFEAGESGAKQFMWFGNYHATCQDNYARSFEITPTDNVYYGVDSLGAVDYAQASLTHEWANNVAASRAGRIKLGAYYFTTLNESIRIESNSTGAMLGFLGANAALRQTVTGYRRSPATTSLMTALGTIGLVTDSTTSNVVALTDAATIATNASLGDTFRVSSAVDRTLGAPTSPSDGQVCSWRWKNTDSVAHTLTLTTGSAGAFRFGSDIAATTATAAGKADFIAAAYNLADDRWDVIAYTKGF